MADKIFPDSQIPIRKTVDLLPQIFKTEANSKFLGATLDPLVQPGTLEKTVGYVGKRFGKTYNSSDIYLDSDNTLRSRYQLEPGVILRNNEKIEKFYDYIDFKNQIKFFNNNSDRDDLVTSQEHYSWNPPIKWDQFVNFREYYWVPEGPPDVKILGQSNEIISTYRVKQGAALTWIFSPDGQTNNPTLTLYRGQTYKFQIKSVGEAFVIRTAFDAGSLNYNPILPYTPNQLAVYDGKLWKAKVLVPGRVGNIIEEGLEWEIVENQFVPSRLDYNNGVTNNGAIEGTIIFEVPLDAPDVLFYQGSINPDRVGRFLIADIESNTSINVEKEILGKENYTSSNGVALMNGLMVRFAGQVSPEKYAKDFWIVENVGTEISLIRFADLEIPIISNNIPDVLFDDGGFDSQPFDDATSYPGDKDYITVCRAGVDNNPWSRYNRWFHRETLEYAHTLNNTDFGSLDSARAKRPIIEFKSGLQLFNHGSFAKAPVDYIDDFTKDVFSTIEGSEGYNVDGEFLFNGARILFTADTDLLVKNKIYRVELISHNGKRQIALRETPDTDPILGEGLLIKRGLRNRSIMYHYTGKEWVKSQAKTAINQPPLFDLFDNSGIGFSDLDKYPISTFTGCKILSYKLGKSFKDTELGFSLSYQNIDNVGDILFEYNLDKESFTYSSGIETVQLDTNTGFYKFNPFETYDNGWTVIDEKIAQPILDSVVVENESNSITLSTIIWNQVSESSFTKILFYRNGKKFNSSYTLRNDEITFSEKLNKGDVIEVQIYSDVVPQTGYYQIPLGLEKNPLNQPVTEFTLGQATDHISTALDVYDEFQGTYPGSSNLRNISGYQDKAIRFLKHSGISPMAISLLCDKEINIVKSIQYAAKSYTDFKNEFIKIANTISFEDSVPDFVDSIISFMGVTKNSTHPFVDTDMIGSGAHTKINYLVEDEEITVFALSEKFDLSDASRKAVYVYLNNNQLIHGQDYEFDSIFGFVRILAQLQENDRIEIREYVSTSFNYIPPTPTKLGLFKKYLPKKYIDDRYYEPKEVIEGHDGSITIAFGDFKDELLLELETRIYNNIKQQYDEKIFDIDSVVGGYYNNSLYGKADIDPIVNVEFLRWVSVTDLDYTNNTEYFRENETFTYTYSNMTDPTGNKNLPGYWRGVYRWFYDTDRPHTAPWEMLGFSEKPTWWDREYGPAPYTRFNLLLWEDIRDGVIRQGTRQGRHPRYARTTILDHIPVDGDGYLLSPLDSGLAGNFSLVNNKGTYNLGDVSPVEYAWRASSEWPFAVIKALCLLKPFEFITDSFDRSLLTVNQLGQTVVKSTGKFVNLTDFKVPEVAGNQTVGLINYVSSYIRSRNKNPIVLLEQLNNLDVNLTTRISGFVDQTEQKYLLDSKNPKSISSNVFVPSENYDIIFNVGVPFASLIYSGVIIEKTDRGWKVAGYNKQDPYFSYKDPIRSNSDPVISVGGTSEQFIEWAADKIFNNGTLVRYQGRYYRCLKSHTSTGSFENNLWKPLPALPLVGGQQALFRRTFDQFNIKQLAYGTILPTVQDVIDFILGYESYLLSIGFTFNKYDPVNQVAYNWATSCKEFMFWTRHNWAVGSLLTLSPAAEQVSIDISLGVADNLFDSFYDYQILKGDGTPLLPNFLNVARDFQQVVISTTNTNDGIYFIQVNFVLKEHVTVFTDRTVFNDVIYDKTTGYRQERIKSRGFRTVDWDGDYTSPGFIFDNVDIQAWQPFIDYRLGDIVSYKAYQYTSLENQFGSDSFDDSKWSRLDVIPKKSLIPNFDYRINQFDDYYNLDADGLGSSQRDLSRHVIGYQPREYLQNLAEDGVSQFKLYQGFIREKGTANAITKVFEKLSRTNTGSVVLKEEWAFKVGSVGGYDQFYENEFRLFKSDFQVNPQPILIAPAPVDSEQVDQYLRVKQSDFTITPATFDKNINPLAKFNSSLRTPGYVNPLDVEYSVKVREDILNLDVLSFKENDHIWVTFDKTSWTVLRYNVSPLLRVMSVEVSPTDDTSIIINFNRSHKLKINDIIGLQGIVNLTGFYKVVSIKSRSLTVQVPVDTDAPEITNSRLVRVGVLTESRFLTYQEVDQKSLAQLTTGSKVWIDKNENNNWEVVEKQTQFSNKEIADYGIEITEGSSDLHNGSSVAYVPNLRQSISSMPAADLVVVYSERTEGLTPYQLIEPPANARESVRHRFGESLAVSPDGKWLAVGTPRANNVFTTYRGDYNPQEAYLLGDIVFEKGLLWRATVNIDPLITGDGSTIDFSTEDWSPVKVVTVNEQGSQSGYTSQGIVTMYEWIGQAWVERYSFVSPDQSPGELYGSKITIGTENGNYYMAVSAPGAKNNKGRVYLYKYSASVAEVGETITYKVTVGPRIKAGVGSFRFYLDGIENPALTFFVGNTYIFDQSDDSNVYYPNPSNGSVQNVHPLNFSADNINGILGGGTVLQTNVTYFIDNVPVSRDQYLANFGVATTRQIQIVIRENSPLIIYYWGTVTQMMGNSGPRRFPTIAREWTQFDNHNYQGLFDPSKNYSAGTIVWANDYSKPGSGKYYQSIIDVEGGDSTLSIQNTEVWTALNSISTSSSLPTTVALEDDGSTIDSGLLSENQLAELVKAGDEFGRSIAMNRTGSILVIGAPQSDGQYFTNYRGIWNSAQEYRTGDVVGVIDPDTGKKSYRRLYDTRSDTDPNTDSSIEFTSTGEDPSGDPWEPVGDSTSIATGKAYIYHRNANGVYELKQTITAGSLADINDAGTTELISSGDQFGYALDIDHSGTTVVISSPQADINLQNQGSAYIFKTQNFENIEYRLTQKLESFETFNNELFGSAVSITENTERIAIGATNSPYKQPAIFDNKQTSFDRNITTFSDDRGYPGQVYVFELKDKTYLLAEKLEANLSDNESFGRSIDASSNAILVGSPDYKKQVNGSSIKTGITRLFKKDVEKNTWNIISEEQLLVDIELLKSISLYDDVRNIKIADVDIIDPPKLKILGIAEQEIKYKVPYDPATYTNGTDEVVVDPDQAWFEKNVGFVWWNISTAKWVYSEQRDISNRVGSWNLLAPGASIDVYEWVESPVSPADWANIADTADGLAEGISGQPVYGETVYSVKRFFSPSTGLVTEILYYFWVTNKKTLPLKNTNRKISAAGIRNIIENPASEGLPILAIIDSDKFLTYNFSSTIKGDSALLNIEYFNKHESQNPVHNEYQLLTEGDSDSLPTLQLERKWLDSLVGFNEAGNVVPDPSLSEKQRYGLSFRPIQTMFKDRSKALKIAIDNANDILKSQPFADLIDFENLNKFDPVPDFRKNLYDVAVTDLVDLNEVGTVRIKRAELKANIVNGEIETVDIIESGFGYRTPPVIEITGSGVGGKLTAELDSQGRIRKINILQKGRKYSEISLSVRYFSVLVNIDSSINNFWVIYSWDDERKIFFKNKVQSYDTRRFWSFVDWYASGVSSVSRITQEINNLYLEPTIDVAEGDIIRIKEYAEGGWALLRKTKENQGNILNNYNLVGRNNGTIQLDNSLYSIRVYDAAGTYDELVYDTQSTEELRFIFKALKENIFVDTLSPEWNKLFFSSIRYVFSEQLYIDWAFKTSFLDAIHNVGSLEQKVNYKNDNLISFEQYIEEVKPYRTTIREYTSRYDSIDTAATALTDFDNPPVYDELQGKIVSVSPTSEVSEQYPWKWWLDNRGYSITSIEVINSGDDYNSPPSVVITGDGTGAEARAYVGNGKVVGIKMVNAGTGYTTAPTVSLVGGNGNSENIARAISIIGDTKVRTFDLSVKFDRITKDGINSSFTFYQKFEVDGISSIFDLKYPPTQNRSKIKVFVDRDLLLNSEYSISFYSTNSDGYTQLRGRLKLNNLPQLGSIVEIEYEKNVETFDAVNRINGLYAPGAGMIGREVNQLMTGIDFGGVQIQGTTFDVSGGWDALPWFTDNWDSVESAADYYYGVDFSTTLDSTEIYKTGALLKYDTKLYRALEENVDSDGDAVFPVTSTYWQDVWEEFYITLPFTPTAGQLITIYVRRANTQETTRIDNQYYAELPTLLEDSSNLFKGNWNKNVNYYPGDIVRYKNKDYQVISEVINIPPPPIALIPTFIGNGQNKFIAINQYIELFQGDTLIFRPIDSDGTVTIDDVNIIDTTLSGGTLSNIDQIYQTASGINSADIVVEGGKFISPDYVPAPEENIPGQVLDSVSIKVYHTVKSGAAPLQSKVVVADGLKKRYPIGLEVLEPSSVIVYVDKVKYGITADSSLLEYEIDFILNEINFTVAPVAGSIVEIISIGAGGTDLLDYQEFIADGDTNNFLTRANFSLTKSVLVTVDGVETEVQVINSSTIVDATDKALIQIPVKPARQQIVKIVCLGGAEPTPLVRVNQQSIVFDGSSSSYSIDRFVNTTNRSVIPSVLVEVNGRYLKGIDTTTVTYDGSNNVVRIGVDPQAPVGEALSRNIKVYVNNQLKRFINDYLYDGTSNLITVSRSILKLGDEIKIEIDTISEYTISNNNLVINDISTLNEGDEITVTWFIEYASMDIVSDQYSGGKVRYQLPRNPLASSYVWVYLNGQRLTQGTEYEVSIPRNSVYLKNDTSVSDRINIIVFGSDIRRPPVAYEIYKDMLNVYRFNRFSSSKKIVLDQDFYYYDQEMIITDASSLFEPIPSRNIPGTVFVNGERIDYFVKDGNKLSQLRRGVQGTAIAEIYSAGTEIVDVSAPENIPYKETQERFDFVSTGDIKLNLVNGNRSIAITNFVSHINVTKDDILIKLDGEIIKTDEYELVLDEGELILELSESLEIAETSNVIFNNLLVGIVGFVPKRANRSFNFADTIPVSYGPCDQIEVFVGGKRLLKSSTTIYDESLGVSSPLADKDVEAEFSVDGNSPYIRLTSPAPAGIRITVIRKIGEVWHDRGENTASLGVTLFDNQSPIIQFVTQRYTELPE
jgi:hypothetical protein